MGEGGVVAGRRDEDGGRRALSARSPACHAGRRAGVSDNCLGRQTAGDLCSRWPRHHQRFRTAGARGRATSSREQITAIRRNHRSRPMERDGPLRSAATALPHCARRQCRIPNSISPARSGEIALDTNRTERVWNWLGSIPHWIYPTVLRKDGQLWRLVVLWISGICLIVGVTGIWIGILRAGSGSVMRAAGSRHIVARWHGIT